MSQLHTLHIFNPETDYALAHGRSQYTPPARVAELGRRLGALPALWAEPGDVIMVEDTGAADGEYSEMAAERGVAVVTPGEVDVSSITAIDPWGWNPALHARLRRIGIDASLLPGEQRLTQLRNLSHRRTTISFHNLLRERLTGQCQFKLPEELRSREELDAWLTTNSRTYLKAPWSSSGRGVFLVDPDRLEAALRWGKGIIKRQGSVMAEVAADKTLDFASEWHCRHGEVIFRGLSTFQTDEDGHYRGNVSDSQSVIERMITGRSDFTDHILDAQREALVRLVAPGYDGPVGIDMLSDRDGNVNACVEINLRRTMGMAAASLYALTGVSRVWTP